MSSNLDIKFSVKILSESSVNQAFINATKSGVKDVLNLLFKKAPISFGDADEFVKLAKERSLRQVKSFRDPYIVDSELFNLVGEKPTSPRIIWTIVITDEEILLDDGEGFRSTPGVAQASTQTALLSCALINLGTEPIEERGAVFRYLAQHEIGHLLRLKHCEQADCSMTKASGAKDVPELIQQTLRRQKEGLLFCESCMSYLGQRYPR